MKELSLSYPAKITHDQEGYYVEFLDFEAFSEGGSFEEAIFNGQEALDVTLLGLIETEQPISDPTHLNIDVKNIYSIPTSSEVAASVHLYKRKKFI